MKGSILRLLLVGIIGLMGFAMTSCSNIDSNVASDSIVEPKAKYTIMFYGCGGGNVDAMLDYALDPLLKEVRNSNGQVRFMVMYSMSKDDTQYKSYAEEDGNTDFFLGEYGMTYRYELCENTFSDSTEAYIKQLYRERLKYKPASEVKLYEKATLEEFIQWCKQTAPAENYILMLSDHGGGFDLDTEVTRGIMYDDNHDGVGLSVKSIAAALQETNTHLKAIYWYGCLMGQLEVLTETAPYCDYQFTSTHVARVNPDHPVSLIKGLNASPNDFEQAAMVQGQELEKSFHHYFEIAEDENGNLNPENCDFGCWRSAKIADINAQVKKLAELLTSNYSTEAQQKGIDNASQSVYVYEWQCPHVDVLDYADYIALYIMGDDANAQAEKIADDLSKAIQAANVYRINGTHRVYGDGELVTPVRGTFSLGISLYDKNQDKQYMRYSANFKDSAFDQATKWSTWLDMNNITVMPEKIEDLKNPCNHSSMILYWLDGELYDDDEW